MLPDFERTDIFLIFLFTSIPDPGKGKESQTKTYQGSDFNGAWIALASDVMLFEEIDMLHVDMLHVALTLFTLA